LALLQLITVASGCCRERRRWSAALVGSYSPRAARGGAGQATGVPTQHNFPQIHFVTQSGRVESSRKPAQNVAVAATCADAWPRSEAWLWIWVA